MVERAWRFPILKKNYRKSPKNRKLSGVKTLIVFLKKLLKGRKIFRKSDCKGDRTRIFIVPLAVAVSTFEQKVKQEKCDSENFSQDVTGSAGQLKVIPSWKMGGEKVYWLDWVFRFVIKVRRKIIRAHSHES